LNAGDDPWVPGDFGVPAAFGSVIAEGRPADFDVLDTVRAIATQRSLPPARIALAWPLGKPGVSAPIIGATQPRHLDEASRPWSSP
jgi:aryl-alcohol dehydrogenase-like predicted oxidoreductase